MKVKHVVLLIFLFLLNSALYIFLLFDQLDSIKLMTIFSFSAYFYFTTIAIKLKTSTLFLPKTYSSFPASTYKILKFRIFLLFRQKEVLLFFTLPLVVLFNNTISTAESLIYYMLIIFSLIFITLFCLLLFDIQINYQSEPDIILFGIVFLAISVISNQSESMANFNFYNPLILPTTIVIYLNKYISIIAAFLVMIALCSGILYAGYQFSKLLKYHV